MRYFVISSDQIRVKTSKARGFLSIFATAIPIKYTNHQMLRLFQAQRQMCVFKSKEDALLYAAIYRDYDQINTAYVSHWGYKQHVVHEVELPENLDLNSYLLVAESSNGNNPPYHIPTFDDLLPKAKDGVNYSYPQYHLVPAYQVINVLSAIDGEGKEYQFSPVAQNSQEENIDSESESNASISCSLM